MLNGIDVSNWQNGIDLSCVPCDFVICKATQGTTYTSPDCVRQVEQAIGAGRLWGVYHYISGNGAVAEADFFLSSIENWIGKGIIVLDWEQGQNSAWDDFGYVETMANYIEEKTGIVPIIYGSKGLVPWDRVRALNAGDWRAQYADNETVWGYQDHPWNEDAYSCVIRQYSSHGRLPHFGGNLDFDKAYITAEQWQLYACPSGVDPQPVPDKVQNGFHEAPATDLAVAVMEGKYGSGEQRKTALGSRYDEIQGIINHIAFSSAETLADEVWAGEYGNGSKRKHLLADRYDEVMAIVNGGGTSGTVYTVKSGDTLSAIASKYGTTYQDIAAKNGISNPNIIYPGMRLTI